MRGRRWILFALFVAGAGGGILAGIVTWKARAILFPNQDFELRGRYQRFDLFLSESIDDELLETLDEVEARLLALEIDLPEREVNLYLCSKEDRYGERAELMGLSPTSQGFVVSPLNRVFISSSFIEEMSEIYGAGYARTLLEGDLAHVITHEVVHMLMTDAVGLIASRSLPTWKVEGYAEWAAIRTLDGAVMEPTLRQRLGRFQSGDYSVGGPFREGYVKASLMVEYLMEVRGIDFDELMSEETIESETWRALVDWASTSPGAIGLSEAEVGRAIIDTGS